MHRAGIFEDASSSLAKNIAKADHLKRWKPARMVYDSMLQAGCHLSVNL
jgi:hypothetical protein